MQPVDGSSSSPPAPSSDVASRIDALVRRRGEVEERRAEAVRLRRGLFGFALVWAWVPFLEGALSGEYAASAFVLHLGLVAPWAILVGALAARRPPSTSVDVAAGGVMLAALLATLAGHRFVPGSPLRAFDPIAVLPLLHLCLTLRPRTSVSVTVSVVGIAVMTAVGFADADTTLQTIGDTTAAAAVATVALFAGRRHHRELDAARLARLRADITAHRLTHHNDELRILSEVDTLTGLANRRSIDRRLPEIAEHSLIEEETIGVIMIDVDHFKRFNDMFGHQVGDRCLSEVARAAAEQIRRKGDLIGRFGGEEFVAVLPGAGLEGTMRVAERIRAAVERRGVPIEGHGSRRVTVSIGCSAGIVTPEQPIEDLMRAADAELYAAKAAGRNRISPLFPIDSDPQHEVGRRVA